MPRRSIRPRRSPAIIAIALALTSVTGASPRQDRVAATVAYRFTPASWNVASLGAIDAGVFDLALHAVRCAVQSGTIADPKTLTIIDYSRPSTKERLWVFDLVRRDVALSRARRPRGWQR